MLKANTKNCRPISLLQISVKFFEQLISQKAPTCMFYKILNTTLDYNMFKFCIKVELISSKKSNFELRGSCINQLISITQEIYKSFDEGEKGASLVISNTVVKV